MKKEIFLAAKGWMDSEMEIHARGGNISVMQQEVTGFDFTAFHVHCERWMAAALVMSVLFLSLSRASGSGLECLYILLRILSRSLSEAPLPFVCNAVGSGVR